MKDSSDNNKDQNENIDKRNSAKFPISFNSAKIVNKQFTSEKINKNEPNFIKRNSPIQPMALFNLSSLKEENNNSINGNQSGIYFQENNYKIYPNYSPLTPQLLPKDHKQYSKKNFPSKEEVCKGNPDYSQKLKIPSSSPITQYFNMDNIFNKDYGFQLETPNTNNLGETPISHLSNISQNDMFNCSPSDFFNRGVNNEVGKNMNKINISEQDNEEDKNKNGKEEGDELYTMKLDNEDNIFKDDNNMILNKINEMKNKKKDKIKTNNNSKQQKLKKKINNNESKLIIKEELKENEINNNINDRSESENKLEDLNNNFELLGINNDSQIKGNKSIIKEENSSSILMSPEMKKKFEEYIDDNYGSPVFFNIDEKQKINNKMNENKNINLNNNENNTAINNNNNEIRNNLNYLPNNNKDNLNFINSMNINCTNLNINNFTNLNKNTESNNFNDANQQLLYYLQQQNNQNNIGNVGYNNNNNFNKNKKQKMPHKNSNNFNNNSNDIYNEQQRMNYFNFMNGMNINNNQYFSQNNMNNTNNNGFPYYFNNNNNNSNNNNQQNNNNDYNKRKKIKKLDSNMYLNKPLSYLSKNLNSLGKDQGACRYLQKLLDENPPEAIQYLYEPLCDNLLQLINDQFGNYLIQKIITYLNEEQLLYMLQIISQYFFEIASNNYGTRVLQKIIDYIKTPKVANYFYQSMKPLIIPLLKELNGTFAVQKFAALHSQYSNEINEIIIENSHVLATHRHGCCVIQKYLEINDPVMTPNLLDKLVENCLLLIIDQFGNYVIQTILSMGIKKYGNKIAEKITENVVYYAKHKYSSNVVEKCFNYCDGNYRLNLMLNVQKKENLIELILDEHGNYVVQKVLSLSPPATQKNMLKLIVPAFEKLKRCPYGDRVINRLVGTYPIITDSNFLSEI